MTRVSEMRELQPKRKAAVHRKAEPLRGISHPTALQWDVHDLLVYNKKARKQGKRELTYGQWSAMGKAGRTVIALSAKAWRLCQLSQRASQEQKKPPTEKLPGALATTF